MIVTKDKCGWEGRGYNIQEYLEMAQSTLMDKLIIYFSITLMQPKRYLHGIHQFLCMLSDPLLHHQRVQLPHRASVQAALKKAIEIMTNIILVDFKCKHN